MGLLKTDWSERESVRAQLRLMVKRILKKYKYPPDQQDEAIKLVLEQAQALGHEWAGRLIAGRLPAAHAPSSPWAVRRSTRWARAAAWSEWVTSTRAEPWARHCSVRASITRAAVLGSRLPVGSSASSRAG